MGARKPISMTKGVAVTWPRRSSPSWMRDVNGCFVFGSEHTANDKHKRDEVTAEIRKLKDKHRSALITIEDLWAVQELCDEYDEPEDGDNDQVEWAEPEDEEETTDIAYIAMGEGHELESNLAKMTFLHSQTLGSHNLSDAIERYNAVVYEKGADDMIFHGIRLYTCANKASVMSKQQYLAYCCEFGLKGQ